MDERPKDLSDETDLEEQDDGIVPSGTRGRRVLVVDDEETDLLGLCSILENAGYEVQVARSGQTAVGVFLECRAHVVVTDIAMKDGDGLDLIRTLRQLRHDLPVVAVSGKGEAGLAAARSMGALAVLAKPVDPAELIRVVGEAGARDSRR